MPKRQPLGIDPGFKPYPIDGPDARNVRLVGHCSMDGLGDLMHINVQNGYAYTGHLGEYGIATSILDVRDPSNPRLIKQLDAPPHTHSHKVQALGDVLLVNREQYGRGGRGETGLKVYDLSNPTDPQPVGFLPMSGAGVHRMTYFEDPYVYLAGSEEGWIGQFFMIVDVSDRSAPREVGRWWFPGQWAAGHEPPTWPKGRGYWCHHPLIRGDRAYCGWWDAGLIILDIADKEKPIFVGRLDFGADVSSATHTALPLPGRNVVAVTDECVVATHGMGKPQQIWLVDIADETTPSLLGHLPVPEGNWCDKCQRRAAYGHFGPHNLHEMRPGTLVDPNTLYATYFNGGLRVFDITDIAQPREIAHYIPEAPPGRKTSHLDDVTVGPDGLIYTGDRFGNGLYILELTGRD